MASDDIVARMRSNARFFGLIKFARSAIIEPEFCQETAEWFTEAADDIERMRAENVTLRKQLDQFVGEFKDEVQREAL
jgi:predicted transcriptional regulator